MIIRKGNSIATTRIHHLRFFCCGCEAPPAGAALAAAAGCLLVVPARKLAISKLAIGLAAAALPLLARCASNSALNSGSTVHNVHLAALSRKKKRGGGQLLSRTLGRNTIDTRLTIAIRIMGEDSIFNRLKPSRTT